MHDTARDLLIALTAACNTFAPGDSAGSIFRYCIADEASTRALAAWAAAGKPGNPEGVIEALDDGSRLLLTTLPGGKGRPTGLPEWLVVCHDDGSDGPELHGRYELVHGGPGAQGASKALQPSAATTPGESIHGIRFALLNFTPDDNPDISTQGLAVLAMRAQLDLVEAHDKIRLLDVALDAADEELRVLKGALRAVEGDAYGGEVVPPVPAPTPLPVGPFRMTYMRAGRAEPGLAVVWDGSNEAFHCVGARFTGCPGWSVARTGTVLTLASPGNPATKIRGDGTYVVFKLDSEQGIGYGKISDLRPLITYPI